MNNDNQKRKATADRIKSELNALLLVNKKRKSAIDKISKKISERKKAKT